jgi:hypothetical protein
MGTGGPWTESIEPFLGHVTVPLVGDLLLANWKNVPPTLNHTGWTCEWMSGHSTGCPQINLSTHADRIFIWPHSPPSPLGEGDASVPCPFLVQVRAVRVLVTVGHRLRSH